MLGIFHSSTTILNYILNSLHIILLVTTKIWSWISEGIWEESDIHTVGPCLVQFWIVHYARTHGSTYVVNDFICRCQSWKMILPILVVMDPTWSSTSVLQSSEIIHSMSVTTVWLGLDLSWLSYLCLSLSAPLSLSWDIFPKAVPKIRPCELWQLSL